MGLGPLNSENSDLANDYNVEYVFANMNLCPLPFDTRIIFLLETLVTVAQSILDYTLHRLQQYMTRSQSFRFQNIE